jgi:dTDP-4-dehydrorhamnose 3,5-epimerase
MIFSETKLKGAFILDIEKREDSRGFFARVFCQNEMKAQGLKPNIAQANTAFNIKKGTVRGMHFSFRPLQKLSWSAAPAVRFSTLSSTSSGEPDLPAIAVELNEDNTALCMFRSASATDIRLSLIKPKPAIRSANLYTRH